MFIDVLHNAENPEILRIKPNAAESNCHQGSLPERVLAKEGLRLIGCIGNAP